MAIVHHSANYQTIIRAHINSFEGLDQNPYFDTVKPTRKATVELES